MNDLFEERLIERASIMEHDAGMPRAEAEAAATVDVQCIRCANFRIRDADPKMAAHGFGNCTKRPIWEYFSSVYRKPCEMFQQATDEIISKRMKWRDDRKTGATK